MGAKAIVATFAITAFPSQCEPKAWVDRQDLMQSSARALLASGRRARCLSLPNGRHGSMGDTPERTMGAALDWLFQAAPDVTD
ncbi:MAG TPA: hypothetical protein VER11_12925 [Polyangiaceae bacterium]|nr:hypothetical protein [Polyangiaceae bacterium]